jgi:1-acyl-sn-glycerol-3-phosphate acyltransferase
MGGPYDFVTIVEAPDNETVSGVAYEIGSLGTVRLNVFPAIGLERFTQLIQLAAYRTEPHRWQTQLWARLLRRGYRHAVFFRHMRRLCKPFVVEGEEQLKGFRGPALIVANHTSHFDTPALLTALPASLRERTAVAAAADRFYRTDRRTWWFSLFWNTYPIARGGGKAALDYSLELLQRGWSILIFPEGGRFKPGQLQRFHHGPSILAMQAKVPVVPVCLDGLDKIMPRGQRTPQPGPVLVRIGAPVSLQGVDAVPEATARLQAAVEALLPRGRAESPEHQLRALPAIGD